MQVRELKKLLGTKRPIADYSVYDKYNSRGIGIGSNYCHNLISINKKTLEIQYALSHTSHEKPNDPELLVIWNKLKELKQLGKLKEIINLNDDIPEAERINIFYVDGAKVFESYTDKDMEITYEGIKLYDNTTFKTKVDAIDVALENGEAYMRAYYEKQAELEKELDEVKSKMYLMREQIVSLKTTI